MSIPTNITREHVLKAIEKIDSKPELKNKRSSSTYDLIFEGKKYPPILVLSIANQINNGKELLLSDFDNNIEKPFNLLRENGFTIIPKNNNYDQTEQALIEYVQTFDEYEWFDEFFEILEYIISEASLQDNDQKIAFTLVKVKKRISINIGARLIFAICRTKKVNWFYVMLNAADIVEARKLSEYYTQEEEDTFKSGVEASLIPFTTGWSTASKLWILKAFSEAVNAQLPAVKSAGQPEKHNNFIYQAAVDLNYRIALKQKIVKNIDLIPEIVEAINSESFQNIIKDKEFYFEKARATFEELKSLPINDSFILDKILLDFQKAGKFKAYYQGLNNLSEEFKITKLIAKLISYCDLNAAFKSDLNEYEDHRVLARAGVRQNNWFENLIEFKKTLNYNALPSSIKNALIYLENPERGITMLSENHRLKFLKSFLPEKQYKAENFIDELLKFFEPYHIVCQNEINYTRALSAILYNDQPVRNLWLDIDEQNGNNVLNTVDSNCKYWLYAPGENANMWEEFLQDGTMGLGWDNLGDLNEYATKEDIVTRLKELSDNDSSKANDATANFDFKETISIGDIIISKKGRSAYLGYGIVTSNYYYDESVALYKHKRKVNWIKNGHWETEHSTALKTLTDITNIPYKPNPSILAPKAILDLINAPISNTMNQPINQILYGPPGTGKTFKLKDQYFPMYTTKETSLSVEQHFKNIVSECSWWQVIALALLELGDASKVADIMNNRWVKKKSELSDAKSIRPIMWSCLQSHTIQTSETVGVKQRQAPFIFNKKNESYWEILEIEVREQIPELYEMLESVNNFNPSSDKEIQRYVFTTFHQSYSYEDFIEGIKPIMIEGEVDGNVSYHIEDGVFKQLCKKAALDPENRYAIFIDEINRGNVSAIFGELITLIEQDKRKGATNAMSALLPYSKNQFSVPQNVDIYGTMNTADRSVEALDTALRRRFSFEEMLPKPELLIDKGENGSGKVGEINLEELLKTINERIEALVDRDHTIGHAFFMEVDSLESLRNVFANKVIPLLQEYFYGDYAKMEMVIGADFFNIKDSSKIKFAVKPEDFESIGKTYHIKNLSDKIAIPDDVLETAFNNMISGAN